MSDWERVFESLDCHGDHDLNVQLEEREGWFERKEKENEEILSELSKRVPQRKVTEDDKKGEAATSSKAKTQPDVIKRTRVKRSASEHIHSSNDHDPPIKRFYRPPPKFGPPIPPLKVRNPEKHENVSDLTERSHQILTKSLHNSSKDRSVTEPQPFQLTISTRLEARKQFDLDREKREQEALEALRKGEEAKEREEIAQFRREAVVHANPVPHYKPMVVRRNTKPATLPVSPKFSDRFKK